MLTIAFCQFFFLQTPSSWLNVCGDGNVHSKNLNVLSLYSSVNLTMFLGIKYIPQTTLLIVFITTKFYHLYLSLLIFPHRTPKLLQANAIAMALGPFLCMHAQDGALFQPPKEKAYSQAERPAPDMELTSILPLNPCKDYRHVSHQKKEQRWKNYVKLQEYCLFIF